MLKVYVNKNKNLSELNLENITENSWINLINPSSIELSSVADITNIPLDILKLALDNEERSHMEIEEDYLLVVINVPIASEKGHYDTLPLSIIITNEYLITVCSEANEVLNYFTNNPNYFSTVKKTRFLFQLLYLSSSLYLKYLRQIIKHSDEVERSLRKSMKNKEFFQLMGLQKGLTFFASALQGNGVVMERLFRFRNISQEQQAFIKIYEEDEDLLEDVIIENKQAIEMVNMYSSILTGMLDAFASIVSNNLNIVMKVLTVITILLAIPNLLAGIWGMNVPVPFAENPHGFAIVVFIALFINIFAFIILWLRGILK